MRFRELNEYVFDDVLQWVRDCATITQDVADLLTANNLDELVRRDTYKKHTCNTK